MDIRSKSKLNMFWIALLLLVVLCSCLILSTLSWLLQTYNFVDENSNIGKIEVAIYADGSKVTGTTTVVDGVTRWQCNSPYVVSSGSVLRTLNLKCRNEGTIDAILRATISIYYMEGTNKSTALIVSTTPTTSGTINLDTTNWVKQFPSETVACGYMFLNSKLEPYTTKTINDGTISSSTNANGEIPIINQILVSEAQKNVVFYVDVTLDAVAYSGNIYKKIEDGQTTPADIPVYAYPFGTKETLPSAWTAWR